MSAYNTSRYDETGLLEISAMGGASDILFKAKLVLRLKELI